MAKVQTNRHLKPLIIDGVEHKNYEIIHPSSRLSPRQPNLFASNPKALSPLHHGSGLFSSIQSITDRATANLSHAKPTLQSSYLNVATPIPLGASHLQLADAFKSSQQIGLEATAPRDRFYLVYLIFLIHGIGVLMPWNMFLTAETYFTDFKLAPLHPNQTETEYAKNFLSYLGITAQLPNLILNAANIFCRCQGSGGGSSNPVFRVVGSIIITIAMFVVTVVLAIVDSHSWQGSFFAITMCTVVVINMCTGVYQNTMFGVAGQLPMKYTNAVIFGSNLSGVLSAVIMIITILASPDRQWAAIWYFVAAIIILCIALDTFFILPFLKFYKHFIGNFNSSVGDDDSKKKLVGPDKEGDSEKKGELVSKDGERSDDSEVSEARVSERPPYLYIFRKIWVQLLGVWLIFFVSLVCFPVLQAGIEPSDPNFFLPENLYTPITTFLIFNLFASLGNLTTEWIRKPGPRFVIIPIILRVLYIPFFMFCNFRPEVRTLPVYISNDWGYIVGGVTMAYTSGYFSSLCMMYSPSLVEPRWAGTAAMISAFFLIFGIISGINFTLVVTKLTEL